MTKISNIVNFGYPYLSFKGLISVWKNLAQWKISSYFQLPVETFNLHVNKMNISGGQLPPHGGNWLVKSQQWFSENPWLMSTLQVFFFLLHYINRRINSHISLRSPKRFFFGSTRVTFPFTQDKGPLDANSASGNPSGGGDHAGIHLFNWDPEIGKTWNLLFFDHYNPRKINSLNLKSWWFGRWISFSRMVFSGSMLIFRGVIEPVMDPKQVLQIPFSEGV